MMPPKKGENGQEKMGRWKLEISYYTLCLLWARGARATTSTFGDYLRYQYHVHTTAQTGDTGPTENAMTVAFIFGDASYVTSSHASESWWLVGVAYRIRVQYITFGPCPHRESTHYRCLYLYDGYDQTDPTRNDGCNNMRNAHHFVRIS